MKRQSDNIFTSEDENDFFNEVFKNIVKFEYEESELPEEYLKCKEYLINEFKKNGTLFFTFFFTYFGN